MQHNIVKNENGVAITCLFRIF